MADPAGESAAGENHPSWPNRERCTESPTSHQPAAQLSRPETISPMPAFLQQTPVQNSPSQRPPSPPYPDGPLFCCTCLWFLPELAYPDLQFFCYSPINPSFGGEIIVLFLRITAVCTGRASWLGEQGWAGVGGMSVTHTERLRIPAAAGMIRGNRSRNGRPPQ